MRQIKMFLLAVIGSLAALSAHAQPGAEQFQEGVHYIRLSEPVRERDPSKIEVVEMFQYTCPHCYRFEPMLTAWAKKLGSDVDFHRVPVVWNSIGDLHAHAFYAAKALGVLSKTHDAMFAAIHEQGKLLNSKKDLRDLFQRVAGVKPAEFDQAIDSFGVDSQVKQAKALALSYKIEGTPELIVAGKFRVDGRAFAGTNMTEHQMHEKMLQVADFLIAKERQQRAKK